LVRNLLRIFFIFLAICLFIPFPALSYQEAAQADDIPWSGYWWPFEFGGLATGRDYRGSPSPLEKYHLITAGVTTGDAINWYKDKYYKPDAQHWEGLCPAFAAAAVQENYSILPSTHENIVFRV
jgi:peptidoglycan/LPS O-acetylase OafA/YrhL